MIASSTVSSDGTTAGTLFSTYDSEITNLESSDVWEGKSQQNAVTQANNFVDTFEAPIESQFSDFSSAVSKYKEWETAKKNQQTAEDNYNDAVTRKKNDPKLTIDLSSYQRKVSEYKTQVSNLKREIDTLLTNVKSKKLDLSNVTVKTPDSYKLCDFVNYYQYNYKQSYGYGTTIASAGCGPTSMAMILTYLLGTTIDPVETANWSLNNGGRCPGNGTYWSYFPKISKAYGIECDQMGVSTNNIVSNLQAGKPIIMSMGPGHFTSGGHYIVLRGLTSDGKVIVSDPNSETRSNQVWDISVFLSEGKGMWAFDSDKTVDMTI